MNKCFGIFGSILLTWTAWAADEKITWDKADGVLARATAVGKPVIWYFVNNQFSKDAAGGIGVPMTGGAEKVFTNHVIIRHREPFLWVRADQALSNQFKIQGAPAIVITDPDGDVLLRASIATPENLYDAMETVLKEKYIDKPVTWGDVVHTGPIKKRLLVLGFDDEKGCGLRALEDRSLVKYHKNCEFVKLASEKGSEAANKWNIAKTPSLIICDAMERVLERISGKLTPRQIKNALLQALAKLEEAHEGRK